MKKIAFFSIVAFAALVSCQKDNLENGASTDVPLVFTASISQNETKTTLDMSTNPAKVFWEESDRIQITDAASHVATYKLKTGDGQKTATFEYESGSPLDAGSTYTATYGEAPAEYQYYSSDGSVRLHMTAPSTSSTDGLCFTADCGVLCISLTDSHTIMRIEVSNGTNTYKVTALSGVENPSGTEKFLLALPEGNYSTINIYDNANRVCTKVVSLDITEGRIKPALSSSALLFGDCTTKGFSGSRAWVKMWADGPKWAETNVGAAKPENYGNYYAWGATAAQTNYNWASVPFNGGFSDPDEDAWNAAKSSAIDGDILCLENDVARQEWGGNWRMPTKAEWISLGNITNFNWVWTTENGVYGDRVTSMIDGFVGNSIFLPAAGFVDISGLTDAGSYGAYWSSSFDTSCYMYAYKENFGSDGVGGGNDERYIGRPVRPVL